MPAAARAEFDTPSGNPVPRWAMLAKPEVNGRVGPSREHRQIVTYTQKFLPVQIISETGEWRLICDPDGQAVWIKRSLLTTNRMVLGPSDHKLELRSSPKADAPVQAVLRPRAMAMLDRCRDGWCKVGVGGDGGWAPQSELWGTQTTPVCRRPDPLAVLR